MSPSRVLTIWWTSAHCSWDRLVSLRHPSKFQRVSRLGSVTARHSGSGRQPDFAALNSSVAITLVIGPHSSDCYEFMVTLLIYCYCYFAPGRGCKALRSVCLSVHLHISKVACPNCMKFSILLTCAHFSVLLCQKCTTVYTLFFVDDIMFSHIGANMDT